MPMMENCTFNETETQVVFGGRMYHAVKGFGCGACDFLQVRPLPYWSCPGRCVPSMRRDRAYINWKLRAPARRL